MALRMQALRLKWSAFMMMYLKEVKSTILNKIIPSAMIYTLGCTENMLSECHYIEMFAETEKFLNMLFGYGETLYAYSTYQFDDYAKYDEFGSNRRFEKM